MSILVELICLFLPGPEDHPCPSAGCSHSLQLSLPLLMEKQNQPLHLFLYKQWEHKVWELREGGHELF